MALYGRHGEAPLPIVAAYTPAHCFDAAIEAVRIALKYRTPVILLSDGYLANGSEPWLLPDVASLPDISSSSPPSRTTSTTRATRVFWPYLRDERRSPARGRSRARRA
jgi:2-oxoglutarate/2-oxoacid ferredoxin oxidoreductase subunit alpha